MLRRTNLVVASMFVVIAFAVSRGASAQVVAYDHRSTVLGDQLAGASELVRAQGSFLVDEATAAETWTRVIAARDQIQYQRAAYRYDMQRMADEQRQRKVNSIRERQQSEAAADVAAALRLYESVQRGGGLWPAALSQPQYAASMTTVTSLLRNWSPEDATSDVYRAALATEIGVLKARVAADQRLNFTSRVEAVRTLKQLERLARMPADALPRAAAGGQLAMQ